MNVLFQPMSPSLDDWVIIGSLLSTYSVPRAGLSEPHKVLPEGCSKSPTQLTEVKQDFGKAQVSALKTQQKPHMARWGGGCSLHISKGSQDRYQDFLLVKGVIEMTSAG